MDLDDLETGSARMLLSAEQIAKRVRELAAQVGEDYRDQPLLLVGVLRGAMMIMADFARELRLPVEIDWMAVSSYGSRSSSSGVVRIQKDLDTDISSYGSRSSSSGVVRIQKDLDTDISGRHVLVVEDILDSGLTLKWLVRNLRARSPASVELLTLLRKPEAVRNEVEVRYVGFDIPDEFVVGYGLDYQERYRNLTSISVLTQPT